IGLPARGFHQCSRAFSPRLRGLRDCLAGVCLDHWFGHCLHECVVGGMHSGQYESCHALVLLASGAEALLLAKMPAGTGHLACLAENASTNGVIIAETTAAPLSLGNVVAQNHPVSSIIEIATRNGTCQHNSCSLVIRMRINQPSSRCGKPCSMQA